jgi:DNA polymerase-3 subunit epsilon
MRILFFDTETTGLPKFRQPARKGPNNWPHLVSISWVILDNYIKQKQVYHIVKPEGWIIPQDSVNIHGITTQTAINNGASLTDILHEFMNERCDLIVAHNLDFDKNVIEHACLWDAKLPCYEWSKQRMFCTMEASTPMCKLPSTYGKKQYKSPKLSELYEYVMKRPVSTSVTLHNSLQDTLLLVDIVSHSPELQGLIAPRVVTPAINAHLPRTLTLRLDEP